jgi:hypothetical protein
MAFYSGVTKQWTQTRRPHWRFWAGLGVALAVASIAVPFRDDALNVVTAAVPGGNPTDAVVVANPAPTDTGPTLPPSSAASRTSEEQRRLILLYHPDGAGLRYFGGLSKH